VGSRVTRPPRVSVIVNCFNGEKYLRETLDSLFAQRMADFEVIFWDNASTDGSAAIAKRYDARLRYFRAPETTELGAARNRAVDKAQGDFLAFLDTDDRWYPDTLETLVNAMSDGIALVYAGIRRIDAAGKTLGTFSPAPASGMLLDPLLRQFDVWIQAMLVRREALVQAGLTFDPAVTASEEYCLFIQLAAEAPIRAIADVVVDYRIHSGALTNRSVDRWADERFYTLDRLISRHPEIQQTHEGALREAYARGHYYRARYFMTKGQPADARRELKRALGGGRSYLALYLLSLLPPKAWNTIHTWKTRRAIG
jgi:glycosyltransferase involved in cell wall biosynthesis